MLSIHVWTTSSLTISGECVSVTIVEKPDAGWLHAVDPEGGGTLTVPKNKLDEPVLFVVRDSKNPDDPKNYFTPGEWEKFVGGVKLGEFDVPDAVLV